MMGSMSSTKPEMHHGHSQHVHKLDELSDVLFEIWTQTNTLTHSSFAGLSHAEVIQFTLSHISLVVPVSPKCRQFINNKRDNHRKQTLLPVSNSW